MIQGWRRHFQQPNAWFGFVQIGAYRYSHANWGRRMTSDQVTPPPPPPPLATDNLFENADGVLHHCSIGAAACYLLFMLTRAIMPLLLHQAGDLRQAQLSALALENVGFSTAIDTSDWLNIHPPDKQTVSSRPVWHLCRITHFRPVNLLGGADGLLRPTSKRGRSNPSMR